MDTCAAVAVHTPARAGHAGIELQKMVDEGVSLTSRPHDRAAVLSCGSGSDAIYLLKHFRVRAVPRAHVHGLHNLAIHGSACAQTDMHARKFAAPNPGHTGLSHCH